MDPNARSLARLAAGMALLGLAACNTVERPVHISSDPPGARVLVDGHDSGFVTPCLLALPRDDQRVDLALDGYVTVSRELHPGSRWDSVYWREMNVHYRTWTFPLWLDRDGTLTPFTRDKSLMPNRIHVELQRQADVRPGNGGG